MITSTGTIFKVAFFNFSNSRRFKKYVHPTKIGIPMFVRVYKKCYIIYCVIQNLNEDSSIQFSKRSLTSCYLIPQSSFWNFQDYNVGKSLKENIYVINVIFINIYMCLITISGIKLENKTWNCEKEKNSSNNRYLSLIKMAQWRLT